MAAANSGGATYILRHFGGEPPYTHTPAEHLQLLRIMSGEIKLPEELRPFVYLDPTWQVPRGFSEMMSATDVIVTELSTSNEYFAGPYALNFSRTSRMLISSAGLRHHPLMQAVAAGQPVLPEVAQDALERMRQNGVSVGSVEGWLVSALWSRPIGPVDYRRFLWEMKDRYNKPVLAVGIAVPNEADAGQIDRRKTLRDHLESAAEHSISFFDPTALLQDTPQSELFARGGTDTAHYADDKLASVGARLSDAARAIVGESLQPGPVTNTGPSFAEFEVELRSVVAEWLSGETDLAGLPKSWRPEVMAQSYSKAGRAVMIGAVQDRVGMHEPLVYFEYEFPAAPLYLAAVGRRVTYVASRSSTAQLAHQVAQRLDSRFPGTSARFETVVNKHFARLEMLESAFAPDAVLVGSGPLIDRSQITAQELAPMLTRIRRLVADPNILFAPSTTLDDEGQLLELLAELGFSTPQPVLLPDAPYAAWLVERDPSASTKTVESFARL